MEVFSQNVFRNAGRYRDTRNWAKLVRLRRSLWSLRRNYVSPVTSEIEVLLTMQTRRFLIVA